MNETEADVIDALARVEKGSRLDEVRGRRQQARENAQKSFLALFAPEAPGGVSIEERYAMATFVAGLHRDAGALAFYRSGLIARGGDDLSKAIEDEIARSAGEGPYGRYPAGPLSRENKVGPIHRVAAKNRAILGARLSAAFEHAHLLVLHPREASPAALQALLDAGWSTTDIVTLSQLVTFLAFQIRAVVGLRALNTALS